MTNVYTLATLAQQLDGVLYGDAKQTIQGVASLSRAHKTELSYFNNPILLESLKTIQAGGILLAENHLHYCPGNAIVVANPLLSISRVAELFTPITKRYSSIHPTATLSASVKLGCDVVIGENTVIGNDVILGDNVSVGANCVLESDVSIGSHSTIHNGVYLHAGSRLGAAVIVDSGVVIGATPFNSIKKQGRWFCGPAVGGVLIGDQVHLGANTIITKGALGDTFIGKGVHIDNLVMIAHDVIIGENSAIAGCAVLGAYVEIGSHCIIGGASCLAPHISLANDVVITGMSTVNKSLTKAGVYSSGTMVCEHRQWRRNAARFRRLDDYITRLIKLEKEAT
ncbi:UDP-3-O-(3-hydroxymyristoyl)glucosamine N-acyltransferase [Legionella brunensis]|uniref:UDP-3-O-[3-hydroxymyristoyl] glucosamine N-acyltransferase n=1 Tax=Legionella brunensis TaxID=29422 RepID=A0A0W0S464_9GAMM|nr:UDP-3-O-(3-hydroxymyristoyl)glucosamine N-acyltransferase [Legionella brunensis]KTC78048.1 UDP-3-O-[3-hydroxymyristoyl] glucosamine N-acyltransferase [Legionella brunensis]